MSFVMVIPPESVDPEFHFVPALPNPGSIMSSNAPRAIKGVSGTIPAAGIFNLPGITGVSATIYVEAAAGAAAGAVLIRFWQDGTAPTTDGGIPLRAGDKFTITGEFNLVNTRLISADGLEHKIHIQYSNT